MGSSGWRTTFGGGIERSVEIVSNKASPFSLGKSMFPQTDDS
jgi:hypothetical protein